MLDKEFLKTLTILYVEDDDAIRDSLSGILSKLFKEVIICNNGQEGLIKFKNYVLDDHKHIDAIVSDINMPNMNGIDMIKGVRELDETIPVILTTAHGESNYLMDAIKLKIAHYLLKPVDTSDLLKNIANLCKIEHNKKLLIKKSTEISHYMDIMNRLASIFHIDINGNITHTNSLLHSITGYNEKELLEMNISEILHQNSIMKNSSDILKAVGEKDAFKGIIKFLSKNGDTFYLNSTIIAQHNDATNELEGFIVIGFDQTSDELEKQQTMQRIRKNIIEQRTKESELQKQISSLENQLKTMQRNNIGGNEAQMILEKLHNEKAKTAKLHNQITHYEEQFKILEQEKSKLIQESQQKESGDSEYKKQSQKEIKKLQHRILELQSTITKLERKLKDCTYV